MKVSMSLKHWSCLTNYMTSQPSRHQYIYICVCVCVFKFILLAVDQSTVTCMIKWTENKPKTKNKH